MTDPQMAIQTKNPTVKGLTFKEQLAQEAVAQRQEEEKRRKWEAFELDLKRREDRANEL